jgi:hypothetical protein
MEMAREDILGPFFLAFTVLDVRTPGDGSLVPSDWILQKEMTGNI